MERKNVTMLQKMDQQRLDRLWEFLNKLILRFPNKEVVARTGYPSGTVSEYLNGKKPVSENFLRKFCEVFHADYNYISGQSDYRIDHAAIRPHKTTITISQRHLLI